jgi:hypothetical protein
LPPERKFRRRGIFRASQDRKKSRIGIFVSLTPKIEAGQAAETSLDRKVAALRAVEAIRMQAAADGGKLPDSLAKVAIVPVPIDPVGARPFGSRREGNVAFLPDGSGGLQRAFRLSYRITLRK